MPTNTARSVSNSDNHEANKARKAERRKLAAERAGALLQAGGLLRLPEVLALIPVSASTWWNGVLTGRFPKGVRLSNRCTCWKAGDIRDLIDRLINGDGQ